MNRLWFFLLGLLLLFFHISALPASSTANAKVKSIGFLPFSTYQAVDYPHLGEGIRDMLASRVAVVTGATVVNMSGVTSTLPAQGGLPLQRILEIGRDRSAELLVAGNLTADNGLRLEVDVYDTVNPAEPIRFNAHAETESEVFRLVDQITLEMAERLYGMRRTVSEPGATAEAPEPQPAGLSPLQTAHPERFFLIPNSEKH